MTPELDHLKTMWKPHRRRTDKLIVSSVYFNNQTGTAHLNNEHWEYHVPYGFREALDIKFEKRIRKKKEVYLWTQGPILSFKQGDTLQSKHTNETAQVQFANPMGWDKTKDKMDTGSVVYDLYRNNTKIARCTCDQMQFLSMLIDGWHQTLSQDLHQPPQQASLL